jgi:hypothetical protein
MAGIRGRKKPDPQSLRDPGKTGAAGGCRPGRAQSPGFRSGSPRGVQIVRNQAPKMISAAINSVFS